MLKVMKMRSDLYKFLSQMYLMELDSGLLVQMKQMSFPKEVDNEELSAGYALMESSLAEMTDSDLDILAADYAKVFLAAGEAQGNAAFPYESVYTSKRRLIGQEAHTDVVQFYAKYGMELGKPAFKIPEDHISVEFEFMAYLCKQWAAAETEDAQKEFSMAQKQFFKNHINNWAVMFCSDAERYAETAFYKGLAKITRGFLQEEKAMFSRL